MFPIITNNLDLIASAHLRCPSVGGKPVQHFLYASEVYGTLFAVFGRFNYIIENDGCRITGMHLELYNYKGAVNIGFVDGDAEFIYNPLLRQYIVVFGIRGLSTKGSTDVSFDTAYTRLPPFIVKKDAPVRLSFARILYKMLGFEFQEDISDPKTGLLKNPIPEQPWFDSEFYSRNGADFYKDEPRPGQAFFDGLSLESIRDVRQKQRDEKATEKDLELFTRIPTPRCTQSVVNLTF